MVIRFFSVVGESQRPSVAGDIGMNTSVYVLPRKVTRMGRYAVGAMINQDGLTSVPVTL
jgi:hypothetical protein